MADVMTVGELLEDLVGAAEDVHESLERLGRQDHGPADAAAKLTGMARFVKEQSGLLRKRAEKAGLDDLATEIELT